MDIGAERLAKFQDFGLKEKAPKVVPKNTVVGESKTVYPPGPAAVPASATGAVDPQGRPAALQPQSASPHGRGGYGLAGRLGGGKGSAGLPPSNGNDEHGPPGRGSPIYEYKGMRQDYETNPDFIQRKKACMPMFWESKLEVGRPGKACLPQEVGPPAALGTSPCGRGKGMQNGTACHGRGDFGVLLPRTADPPAACMQGWGGIGINPMHTH